MPKQTTKSVMGSSVDPHIKAHANDETTFGIVRLPPGITNGIAKVQECYFAVHEKGKKNEGKIYFRAMAVVVSPASVAVNGSMIPVKNLQTSIVLPWDYPKGAEGSVEKSKATVMNELRKLAGDEATNACQTGQDLEALAAAVEEASPYIRFSTSESKPQIDPTTGKPKLNPNTGKPYDPQVWENWHGTKGLENYGEEHPATPDVKDNSKVVTKAEASVNGKSSDGKSNDYRDDEDLTSLAKRAGKEEEVANRLKEMAMKLGYSEEEVDESNSWLEVVGWIKSGEKKDGGSSDGERTPKIDDAVKYAPTDPKNENKRLKPVDCTVTQIDRKGMTVELTRLDDRRKKYKEVSWDELDYE